MSYQFVAGARPDSVLRVCSAFERRSAEQASSGLIIRLASRYARGPPQAPGTNCLLSRGKRGAVVTARACWQFGLVDHPSTIGAGTESEGALLTTGDYPSGFSYAAASGSIGRQGL